MIVLSILQIIVAAGIFNVWILRFGKETPYRGKSAKNLSQEFAAYGLPAWFVWVVGILKVGSAAALILGFWWSPAIFPAAVILALLMAGAIAMHLKVGDGLIKFVPATLVFLMTAAMAALTWPS